MRIEQAFFGRGFRRALDGIRSWFGRPRALLVVTCEKYDAMLSSEFGRSIGLDISDEDVRELSGFDQFFGPDAFLRHIANHGGKCEYLLYARTSDPIEKLRCPEKEMDHTLLSDPDVRRVIKGYALTFNVDAPEMREESRINDTKAYLSLMSMAYPLVSEMELFSRSFLERKEKHSAKPFRYSERFCFK